jgi:D-sedoheptulose 7-phosphate isomerase
VHAASDLLAIPGLPAFDAVALPANLSALTAFANDVSFDEAFALQLERRVRPGDLVLAVSCSGNSPNLVRALEVARAAGAVCAGVLGNGGGKAGDLCDVTLALDCNDPIVVEGVHDVVLHAVIAALRV